MFDPRNFKVPQSKKNSVLKLKVELGGSDTFLGLKLKFRSHKFYNNLVDLAMRQTGSQYPTTAGYTANWKQCKLSKHP